MNGALLPLTGSEPLESSQGGQPCLLQSRDIASAPAVVKHLAGDYAATAADGGRVLYSDSGSALIVTVPADLPIGWQCAIVQGGVGQVTVAAAGSVTVSSRQSFTKTAGQYALISLMVVTKNSLILLGDGA